MESSEKVAGFVLGDLDPEGMMTPEQRTDEQRMLRETTKKFVDAEVMPRLDELEKLNPELLKELLRKLGDLGLCMIDIPEEYGGLGLDLISSIQPPELLNRTGGVQVAHTVQTVIGMLPILYFGSEHLKSKYLPGIATAERLTAYALTEPGSGSDALAARTTAVASEDGRSWILNGSKQFITNGGIADLFTVFAKVDGKEFSAFAVERGTPGFRIGAEEHKLGIKSSSTTSLSFNQCEIPKENLIGEPGWGGKIALNALNLGRLKLGVAAIGGAKEALEVSVKYALERKQFGRPIAEFGLIREKIAEMAALSYVGESSMYRTAGAVDRAMDAGGASSEAKIAALSEFNAECAIEKVQGSEILAYCVDEAVQIHGGYGFIEEYPVARFYRDARIARLYEGTNEINRLHIAGEILKKSARGDLGGVKTVAINDHEGTNGPMRGVADQIRRTKQLLSGLCDAVAQGRGGPIDKYGENQELLRYLADLIIAIYGLESALGRAVRARGAGSEHADVFEAMTQVHAVRVADVTMRCARDAIGHLAQGGGFEAESSRLAELAVPPPRDAIELRRRVARTVLERRGAWFD